MKIYCAENSGRTQWETLHKGWRPDLIVEIGNQHYSITIYDIVRLQQDFETSINEYGYYQADPNLIIVEEVSPEVIKSTIENLEKGKYFEKIKPLENVDLTNLEEYI